jgi:hypothetical protein
MASESRKLANTFRRSWVSDEECVRFFDELRVRRQNALVLGRPVAATDPQWRPDQGPVRFLDLATLIGSDVGGDDASVHARAFSISLACALIAELLATIFNDDRRAGAVFDVTPESVERLRNDKQVPLLILRNAVCHPGYLPTPWNESSHVDRLLAILGDEQAALKRDLERSRFVLSGPAMARWAVRRVDDLGRFELGRALLGELRGRGIAMSLDHARRIESRAIDHDGPAAMIRRLPSAASVSDLVAG